MSGQLQKALVIYDYHKKTTTEISLEKSQVVNTYINFVYISFCFFHIFFVNLGKYSRCKTRSRMVESQRSNWSNWILSGSLFENNIILFFVLSLLHTYIL